MRSKHARENKYAIINKKECAEINFYKAAETQTTGNDFSEKQWKQMQNF
jgi:hypothetical protein